MQNVQQCQLIVDTKTLKYKVQDNTILISWEETQGTSSAFAQFSADAINEISQGLIDSPEELQKVIESSSKLGLLSISQQGHVLIKFNFEVAGKTKTKNIHLTLKQKQICGVQAIKIQNQKLKLKTKKLQKQVADLKNSFNYLQSQFSTMAASISKIQNKWPLVDKFFINDRFYQLNEHWQLHTFSNVVEFVRKNGNNDVRVTGITIHDNQTKSKRFLLQ